MKLKTFISPSMPAAMEEIRSLFGENAVIVSSSNLENRGVKLIVATEEESIEESIQKKLADKRTKEREVYFKNILKQHHLPNVFIHRLVQAIARKSSKQADGKLLANAFEEVFHFKPLYPIQKNIYVIAGAHGSGKTLAIQKMAFQAKKEKLKTAIVSLDTIKSGAVQEMQQIANMMKIPFTVVSQIKDLNEVLTMMRLSADYILVDTPGINPYAGAQLNKLKAIRQQLSDAVFMFTMPAGLEIQESITQSALFARIGYTNLIATKTDCASSYSGLLMAGIHNQLQWRALGFSSAIQVPLQEATASALADLCAKNDLFENEGK